VRLTASPGTFLALRRMNLDIDVRAVLPSIHVPTLLLHRPADAPDAAETQDAPIAADMAEQIPAGRVSEVHGDGPWPDVVRPHLEQFLPEAWTARGRGTGQERVLATVLFTDLVGSTAKAAELGPRWPELLSTNNATIRRELELFDGSEIETSGETASSHRASTGQRGRSAAPVPFATEYPGSASASASAFIPASATSSVASSPASPSSSEPGSPPIRLAGSG
jgi:hypothetical protein